MADKELLRRILESLQNEFRKSFPPAGIKAVRPELLAAPDKALEKAFDYYVLNGRFPSPQNFRDQVLHESKLIAAAETRERESEWARTKGVGDLEKPRRDLERQASIFSRQQQEELAKDTLSLIKNICCGNFTRVDRIKQHAGLATKYPSVGFALTKKEEADIFRIREHWRPVEEAHPLFQRRYRLEQEQLQAETKVWQEAR
jgi:hypothetical protein